MRLLRLYISAPYTSHFHNVFQKEKSSDHDYKTAIESLKRNFLIYPTSFAEQLNTKGIEVLEVIADFNPTQKKWASEHGSSINFFPFHKKNQQALVWKQIQTFKPDILYFERSGAFCFFPKEVRLKLKDNFPFLKLITGHWAEDGLTKDLIAGLDLVFCMDDYLANQVRASGIKAEILNYYFEENLFNIVSDSNPKTYQFIFAGTSGFGLSDHYFRYQLLCELMSFLPLEAWTFEYKFPLKMLLHDYLTRRLSRISKKKLKRWNKKLSAKKTYIYELVHDAYLNQFHPTLELFSGKKRLIELYPNRVHAPLFGLDYYRLIKRSHIVLNSHTASPLISANIRTFEVTGLGSCLLTDRGEQMKHLFEMDKEIVSYSTLEDAKEKAAFLLDRPNLCQAIGQNAQNRVKQCHLFRHRLPVILESLSQAI